MKTRLTGYFSLFTILLFSTPFSIVLAQAGQAERTDQVRDQRGAVISDARVSLTEVRTNQINTSRAGTSVPANAAFQNELPTFTIDGFQPLGPAANTVRLEGEFLKRWSIVT
jgi:hypothetical protein